MDETSGLPVGTWQAIRRADGRLGTRNYLAVLVASNCAASAARQAADWFDRDCLAQWPNVDGVLPMVHDLGCGMEMTGEPMDLLRRTLAGFIRHPNIAGAVVLALGCERNNVRAFFSDQQLQEGPLLRPIVLQQEGGTRAAVQAARQALLDMLPLADRAQRVAAPLSSLTVGIVPVPAEPGGQPEPSDAGMVDAVAELAGRTIVAGTLESALGRSRPQGDIPVIGYAERVPGQSRLAIMQAPQNMAVTATGLVASGATMLCALAARRTDFGAGPVPCLKLATSPAAAAGIGIDVDAQAGADQQGSQSLASLLARHASGTCTLSERHAGSDMQFEPWPIGVLA